MQNLLITGGAGFIGCNFVRYMLDKYPTYNVVVYDKLTYAGRLENLQDIQAQHGSRLRFVRGDICDASAVDGAVRAYKIDAIVNFAAETHVDRSIMNPDAFQQIVQLSVNAGVNWMGPNASLQGAPNGTLMGRPIILSDACDTVGDQGDIILANMAGYRAITKAGGEEFSESMHLWFDQDVTAFKLVFRMDGQPARTSQSRMSGVLAISQSQRR